MVDGDLFVPYHVQGIIGDVRSRIRVLGESYDEFGVTLRVRTYAETLSQLTEKVKKNSAKTQDED
jgi:GTP-binding protein HflX